MALTEQEKELIKAFNAGYSRLNGSTKQTTSSSTSRGKSIGKEAARPKKTGTGTTASREAHKTGTAAVSGVFTGGVSPMLQASQNIGMPRRTETKKREELEANLDFVRRSYEKEQDNLQAEIAEQTKQLGMANRFSDITAIQQTIDELEKQKKESGLKLERLHQIEENRANKLREQKAQLSKMMTSANSPELIEEYRKKISELDEQIDTLDPTILSRTSNWIGAVTKGIGGSALNAADMLLGQGYSGKDMIEAEIAAIDRQIDTYKKQLAAATDEEREKLLAKIAGQETLRTHYELQLTDALDAEDEQTKARSEKLHQMADALTEASIRDRSQVTKNLGKVGEFLADGSVMIGGMAVDLAAGAATGTGMLPMALRVFGSSSQQARWEGASRDEQFVYGTLSALTAAATERISNVAKPLASVFGRGVTDKTVAEAVQNAIAKMATTQQGRRALGKAANVLLSAGGEGFEEGLEGIIDPYLQRLTYNPDAEWNWDDIAYQALQGAFGGGIFGLSGNVMDIGTGPKNTGTPLADAASDIQNEQKNTASGMETGNNAEPGSNPLLNVVLGRTGDKGKTSQEAKSDAKAIVEKLKDSISTMESREVVSKLSGSEFGKSDKGIIEQVTDFFAQLGNKITRKGFGDVIIDRRSVKNDVAHGIGRAKAATFAAVPDVIANGIQIDYQPNWKGRGADSYIFAAPVEIGGKKVYVGTVVLKDADNRFYLHEVVDENGNILFMKKDAPGTIKTGVTAQNGITGSPGAPISDTNIPQSGSGVKNDTTMPNAQNTSNGGMELNPLARAALGLNNTGVENGGKNGYNQENSTVEGSAENGREEAGQAEIRAGETQNGASVLYRGPYAGDSIPSGTGSDGQTVSGRDDRRGLRESGKITSTKTKRTYGFREIEPEGHTPEQRAIAEQAAKDGVEVRFYDGAVTQANTDGTAKEITPSGVYLGNGIILLDKTGRSYGHELFHYYEDIRPDIANNFIEKTQQYTDYGNPNVMALMQSYINIGYHENQIPSEIAASTYNFILRGTFEDDWGLLFSDPQAVIDSYNAIQESLRQDAPDGIGAMTTSYPSEQKRSRTESNTLQAQEETIPEGARGPLYYDTVSEEKSLSNARLRLNQNYEGEKAELANKINWTGEEQDMGQMILSDLRRAAKESGDWSEYRVWRKTVQQHGTEAAQSLQALAKWTRNLGDKIVERSAQALDNAEINPDISDKVLNAVSELADRYDTAAESGDTQALTDIIRETAKIRRTTGLFSDKLSKEVEWAIRRVTENGDTEFLKAHAANGIEAIASDYTAPSKGDLIVSIRRMAMLSKITTTMRNFVSNNVFDPVDSISRDISVPLDILISKFTGQREVSVDKSWVSEAKRKGALDGLAKSILEVALDVQADPDAGSKYEIGQTKGRTFKMKNSVVSRFMSTWEKYLSYALQTTDQMQKGGIGAEIERGMKELYEKGLTTSDSVETAKITEALYRTFQDENALSKLTVEMRNALNHIRIGGENGLGMGDVAIPFAQVPASLGARALEYSPVGLTKSAVDLAGVLKKAKNGTLEPGEQAKAVQGIGRGINGSAFIGLAAVLSLKGIIKVLNAGDDDDRDKTALERASGMMNTQFNLDALIRFAKGENTEWREGDTLLSIDFLDPLNAMLTTGALIADDIKEDEATLGSIAMDSLSGTLQSVMDLPVMSTLQDAVNEYTYSSGETTGEKVLDAAASYAASQVSSFVPNIVKGVAQGTDEYERDTYTSDSLLGQTIDSVKAGIPGLRETLPAKTDNYGNPIKNSGGVLNFLNRNILPGSLTKLQQPELDVTKLLANLNQETGATKMYPDKSAPNRIEYTTVDGETVSEKMTLEEKRTYQQIYGDVYTELVRGLVNGSDYSKLSTAEVIDILTDVKGYAAKAAKQDYAKSHGDEIKIDGTVSKAMEAEKAGIDLSEFYTLKRKYDEIGDRMGSATDKANKWARYLDSIGLTDKQENTMRDLLGYSSGYTAEATVYDNYKTPVSEMSDTAKKAGLYLDSPEKLGIDFDTYSDIVAKKSVTHSDYYDNGKTKVSAKEKMMGYINEQPLTPTQKDAMYYLFGWSASTIHEAPWR